MRPDNGPHPTESVLACAADAGHIHVGARERDIDIELVVLLGEVGGLVAGQVAHDQVGFLLPDLQQGRTELGGIGGQHIVGYENSPVIVHELLGPLEQIVPKSVIGGEGHPARSAEHTSELQSLMRTSYSVFGLKKKTKTKTL